MGTLSFAQIKTPQPSPNASFKQTFGLGEISVNYSRPQAKGRVIFGDLVPFDKLWRTGANASTKVSFTDDVTIEGNKLPAGEYALYTIPGKMEWTLIFHKNIKLWGLGDPGEYKEENDALRIKVKPQMSSLVENLTISVSDVTANTCKMNLEWEKTRVTFNVSTDIDAKISASIEKTLNPKPDANSYFSAASYYFENDKDLNKALDWVNLAIAARPDAFWMVHLKAKIYKKLNNKVAATEAAMLSKEIASKEGNADYVALNDKLIAEMAAPVAPKKIKN
jgi:type IV secretory pathway VirB9-like protein